MNNNIKPVRVSRSDAAQLRAKFAQRRAEDEVRKEVNEIKEDIRDRRVSDGEVLRREMVKDSISKGARAGSRAPEGGCFDASLIRRLVGGI